MNDKGNVARSLISVDLLSKINSRRNILIHFASDAVEPREIYSASDCCFQLIVEEKLIPFTGRLLGWLEAVGEGDINFGSGIIFKNVLFGVTTFSPCHQFVQKNMSVNFDKSGCKIQQSGQTILEVAKFGDLRDQSE